MCGEGKATLTGTFIASNAYMRKGKDSKQRSCLASEETGKRRAKSKL